MTTTHLRDQLEALNPNQVGRDLVLQFNKITGRSFTLVAVRNE
jgi:hypothetical protein